MKKKIFIVDDDIITLKILKKYLDEKYEVTTENAGYRAIDKLENLDTDLILLDLEMPVMNGLQVFDDILASKRLKDIPVLFLSGISDPNLVRELRNKGAYGYLVKTTPKNEIIDKIEQVLKESADKKVSRRILVLEGDLMTLKKTRDTLMNEGYEVKATRTMLDAISYLNNDSESVDLCIIGNDSSGARASEIYEQIGEMLRKKDVLSIVMNESYFDTELLDLVEKAFK